VSEALCSVGLDIGTTTTQMIVSRLQVENTAGHFSVPQMTITGRQVLYRGQVHFTPLKAGALVDGQALRALVEQEYARAGITRGQVDTGAVIVTGETSRKENAGAVAQALSDFAGDFVVATAGPHLESVLAAKGSGAVEYSAQTGKTVLHMDIGGGTSNFALIENGCVTDTGCLNVGGRLIKLDGQGVITYVSDALAGITELQVGDCPTGEQINALAQTLTQALEMACGLRPPTPLLEKLATKEAGDVFSFSGKEAVLSFSGGVAEGIMKALPMLAFGDIGPALGQAIRQSRLCQGQYRLAEETIRATVIGAGCHSAQLSGSTVYYRQVALPVKNLPVVTFTAREQEQPDLPALIRRRVAQKDSRPVALWLPGYPAPTYQQVQQLANALAKAAERSGLYLCIENDMAKALGHSLALQLPPEMPVLCIDRVQLTQDSFLDVGMPVGPCLPVVVKTLVLAQNR